MSLAHLEILTANRPGPHAEQVGVRYTTLESAVAEAKRKIEEALNRPCSNCGAHEHLFEPRERDDGKYAPRMFARVAACLADERKLMGEGLVTTAGAREMV